MYDSLYYWMRDTFWPQYKADMTEIKSGISSLNALLSHVDQWIFYIGLTLIFVLLLVVAYKAIKVSFYKA